MAKNEVVIKISGGPPGNKPWGKWRKDGVDTLIDTLTAILAAAQLYGEYQLVGVTGKPGNNKHKGFIAIREVSAADNSVVIFAQPGTAVSRWRYKLHPPTALDVIGVHEVLDNHFKKSGDGADTDESPAAAASNGTSERKEGKSSPPPAANPSAPNGQAVPAAAMNGNSSPVASATTVDAAALVEIIQMAERYREAETLLAQKGSNDNERSLREQMSAIEAEIKTVEQRLEELQSEAELLEEKLTAHRELYGRAEEIITDPAYADAAQQAQKMMDAVTTS